MTAVWRCEPHSLGRNKAASPLPGRAPSATAPHRLREAVVDRANRANRANHKKKPREFRADYPRFPGHLGSTAEFTIYVVWCLYGMFQKQKKRFVACAAQLQFARASEVMSGICSYLSAWWNAVARSRML